MRILKVLLIGLSLFGAKAYAQAPAPYVGVTIGGGTTIMSGSLTKKDQVSSWGTSVEFGDGIVSDTLGGYTAGFSFNIWNVDAKQESDKFPFRADDNVNISVFSLSPQLCFLANYPVSVCTGIGFTNIQVNDEHDNSQNYGGISPSYAIGRFQRTGLLYGIKGSYDVIEQEVEGKRSFIGMANHIVMVGWSWTPGE